MISVWQIKGKKGGKFGKGKDNFKCKYAKETLYVSKIGYGGKKKCYYTYKTACDFKVVTSISTLYRVTILDGYNLPLTKILKVSSTCLDSR